MGEAAALTTFQRTQMSGSWNYRLQPDFSQMEFLPKMLDELAEPVEMYSSRPDTKLYYLL